MPGPPRGNAGPAGNGACRRDAGFKPALSSRDAGRPPAEDLTIAPFTLKKNEEQHRYEAFDDAGLVGYSEYNLLSDSIMFTHTEVLPGHEGKGAGGFMASALLDDARKLGRFVIPACPFIAAHLRKHREYIDLVKPEIRRAFKV
ncbi:MAG: GNAT family N-acetyltransferase [Betaproteobacteria bacterium]